MTEVNYSVILFLSVSHALKAERLLKQESQAFKLIPVPRHISSDCGVCIRIDSSLEASVEKILTGSVPFSEIRPLND